MKSNVYIFGILVLCGLVLTAHWVSAQEVVGEIKTIVGVETPHPYKAALVPGVATWSDTIYAPGATFLKLHFTNFNLDNSDYMIIKNPEGTQNHQYDAEWPSDFWAVSIFGDKAILELYSFSPEGGEGFQIPEFGYGTKDPICPPPSLCGVDVECPNVPSHIYPRLELPSVQSSMHRILPDSSISALAGFLRRIV